MYIKDKEKIKIKIKKNKKNLTMTNKTTESSLLRFNDGKRGIPSLPSAFLCIGFNLQQRPTNLFSISIGFWF